MKNKHIILVGLGSIGQRHFKNVKTLLPDATVTIVRRSRKTMPDIECLADKIVDNIDDAIAACKPYACIISSPSTFHVADAMKFAAVGCPIFVEKPLSHSLSELSKLAKLVNEHKVIIMIAYILRFLPTMQRVKNIIDKKQFGDIVSASVSVGQYLPDWRPNQDYKTTVSAQKKLGGGALLELSHEIDYILHLFGYPEKLAASVVRSGKLEIDVEDSVDSLLMYPEGFCVHLHLDFLQKVSKRCCQITFDKAQLKWDVVSGKLSIETALDGKKVETVSNVSNEIYINELRYFFDCIDSRVTPSIGLHDGTGVLSIINAIENASAQDSVISVEKAEQILK